MRVQQGEIREIGIEIVNQLGQDFIIEAADYQIIRKDGTEIDKGHPSIDEHKLIVLFSAAEKGQYYIIFTYHIGPEILKAKVFVEVT